MYHRISNFETGKMTDKKHKKNTSKGFLLIRNETSSQIQNPIRNKDGISGRGCLRAGTALILAAILPLTGCERQISETGTTEESSQISLTTAAGDDNLPQAIRLGLNADVLPSIEGVTIDENAEDLAPVNLTVGVINSVVAELQQRLMDLGYMDDDEPTTYYGDATSKAVQYFQRQKGMTQDGITGVETWDALMADDAPHYAVSVGFSGTDVTNIQDRLYNLGYLSDQSQVTGTYTEETAAAVKKLQQLNGLTADGTVGTATSDLLYSDTVKANVIALGEQSDLVSKYQNRLKELGYYQPAPNGTFDDITQMSIRAFQSRNNLVIDGYLGPDTRAALDSPTAKPYGMRIGEQSDQVKNLQTLLAKYGYLSEANESGYFGAITQAALESFQKRNGLTVDGTAGAQTMSKLQSGNVKKAPSTSAGRSSSKSTKKNGSSSSSAGVGSGGATVSGSASALISVASSKIGSPYVWGSKGPNSFDCSGFVYWCLNQAGVNISYMSSSGWRNPGRFKKVSFGELQAGDIVVVKGHVGICAGGGTVIDASSSNGRVVHRSLSGWWANNFITGWRIFS